MYNMTSYMKQCLEILCCYVGASMQSGMYSGNCTTSSITLTALSDRSLIRQSGSLQSLTLSLTDVCKFTLENI